ncbi:hypothetical protein BASA50_010443 [Batrachochytrium salamandrivorans]|uniref:Telomere length regulation protein conserved domain-containing protein n=1 Tax=Batrachochytrium salamandrivorans TaxID=1357716 RepID=A0ABQ8F1L7_9FUNG|nr:hypothetical protein BASA50_010443 [Batrachochytrium salamandrivorans]
MTSSDLCDALKGVDSVDSLRRVLEILRCLVEGRTVTSEDPNDSLSTGTSQHILPSQMKLHSSLLRDSVVQWVICLTIPERESLYDIQFIRDDRYPHSGNIDLVLSIESLYEAIRCSSNATGRRLLSATLAHFLQIHDITSLMQHALVEGHSVTLAAARWTRIRRVLSIIPDLPDILEPWLETQQYCQRIGGQMMEALQTLSHGELPHEWAICSLAYLLEDLIKRGHAVVISSAIIDKLMASKPRNNEMYLCAHQIVPYMSRHEQNIFLLAVLQKIQELNLTFDASLDLFKTISGNSACLGSFACWEVQQQKLDATMLDLVLWLVFKSSGDNEMKSVLKTLTSIWTSRDFVIHGAYEYQKSIFISLVLSCQYCPISIIKEDESIRKILSGVPLFLELAGKNTRMIGLRFAEIVSSLLHPSIELNLELPESDELKDLQSLINFENIKQGLPAIFPSCVVVCNAKPHTVQSNSKAADTVKLPTLDNPDSIVAAPEGGLLALSLFDDDSSDDESEAEVNNIDQTKPPIQTIGKSQSKGFLSDSLSALKSNDNPDRFERCLMGLSTMIITSTKLEIEEFCASICSALVAVEDMFDTPEFDLHRVNAWAALFLRKPQETAQFTAHALFDKQCNLSTKFWILRSWNALILGSHTHTFVHDDLANCSILKVFQLFYKEHGDVVPVYQISQTCLTALFGELQVQRNWRQIFKADEQYMLACEILNTCKVLMVGAVGSPHRTQLFDQLGLFLSAFEREESRLMFINQISDLARIYEAGKLD